MIRTICERILQSEFSGLISCNKLSGDKWSPVNHRQSISSSTYPNSPGESFLSVRYRLNIAILINSNDLPDVTIVNDDDKQKEAHEFIMFLKNTYKSY